MAARILNAIKLIFIELEDFSVWNLIILFI